MFPTALQVSTDTIPIDGLMKLVDSLSKEANLSGEVKDILLSQVSGLQDIYGRDIQVVEALNIISKQIEITKTGLIREPVGLMEFLESPGYMNQGAYIRPKIMEHLVALFQDEEQYYEVVLGGAIGIGKNYFADMAVSYILYKMSCLYSPQAYYGLAPGSDIVFVHQSKTLLLARKVVFNQFAARLKSSGYFPKYFPFSESFKAQLKFPNSIYVLPISSSDTASLGMNVFCFPAEQQYLTEDGNLDYVGNVGPSTKKTLTLDELNCIFPSEYDGAIYSGESELVRLTFENGDTIECTPSHLFRGEGNQKIRADEAAGRFLDFVDVQTMREAGYISDSAFAEFPPNVREGIQKEISQRTPLWDKAVEVSTGQERSNRLCNLSDMREQIPYDIEHPPCLSQCNNCRVQREISRCSYEDGGIGEYLVGEVQKPCFGAASRSEVQKVSTDRNPKNFPLRQKGIESKIFRSEGEIKVKQSGQEKVGIIPSRNKAEVARCCKGGPGGTQKVSGALVLSLQNERRKNSNYVFSFGNYCRLLDGQDRGPLGLRAKGDSVYLQGEESFVYSRFSGTQWIFRSEGIRNCLEGQALEVKNGSCSRLADFYPRICKEDRFGACLWLDGKEQNTGDNFRRTPHKVQKLRCVRVESLKEKVPVYDVTNVRKTHYFFAKTQSGFLVASNSAVLDELNFMGRIRRSKLTMYTGEEEYDQAEKLYTTILRRLESRYAKLGKLPGKLFLISSASYRGDFIDRKEEEARLQIESEGSTHIYIMHMSQWEALPKDRFCGTKFWVLLPTNKFKGAILEEEPVDKKGAVEVPIEFRGDFQKDLIASLRDLGGIAVARRSQFIDPSYIETSFSLYEKVYGSIQIFPDPGAVFENIGILESLLNIEFLRTLRTKGPFGVHVDLALSGDSAGIGIGHVVGSRDIGSRTVFDVEKGSFDKKAYGELPMYALVGLLKVMPPTVGEINLNAIRDLLFLIADYIPLQWVSFDSFQSAALIQSFRARNISSFTLSVDKTPAPYMETKYAMGEQRVLIPRSIYLEEDMESLEQDAISGKIDHRIGMSKDVSDAVAGVVYEFSKKKRSYRKGGNPYLSTGNKKKSTDSRPIQRVRPTIIERPSTGRESLY